MRLLPLLEGTLEGDGAAPKELARSPKMARLQLPILSCEPSARLARCWRRLEARRQSASRHREYAEVEERQPNILINVGLDVALAGLWHCKLNSSTAG